LPTGLTVGATYFVVNASANTFSVSATIAGSPITTSGSQSGLQYISQRGVNIYGVEDVNAPILHNYLLVSDSSRFVILFGSNEFAGEDLDPMLIRWSDQESPFVWTPSATNQAGSIRLSIGSQIVAAIQTRQEIVVLTDEAVYSMQYLGPPFVWGIQPLGDNVSIAGPNAVALASGVVYWMGVDKFYMYDGRVQTLSCDLRKFIFNDFNRSQNQQTFAGTNEGFNEVWWFYCSANSDVVDRYVIFNYLENIWYYGTMERTAWLDSGLLPYPIAATYSNNLVNQEEGVDDFEDEDVSHCRANRANVACHPSAGFSQNSLVMVIRRHRHLGIRLHGNLVGANLFHTLLGSKALSHHLKLQLNLNLR